MIYGGEIVKTAYQVRMVYDRVLMQVDNMYNIASELDNKIRQLEEAGTKLSKYWSGNNASAYRNQMSKRESELIKLSSDIREIAQTIGKMAKNNRDADLRAIQTIQQKALSHDI